MAKIGSKTGTAVKTAASKRILICDPSKKFNTNIFSFFSAPKACDTVAVSGGSETGSHLPAGLRGAAVITSRVKG